MGKGRVMAIDFGMRHIGVALSDELRIIASGFETVNWNGEDDSWAVNRIAEIVKEKNVAEILLGKPSKCNGEESESERKAKLFGEKVEGLRQQVPRKEWLTTAKKAAKAPEAPKKASESKSAAKKENK